MRPRVETRVERWYERLTLFRAVSTIIALTLILVLIAGVLVRLVEPDTFTSIGLSYWWAVETVTTVGYGDVVPKDPPGRIVGVLLMLTGLALIPTLTSVIVSTFLSKGREAEQERLEQMVQRVEEHLSRIEQGP
ncbi:MAG: potassium channel family protein [Gaiellaceae bacterium]